VIHKDYPRAAVAKIDAVHGHSKARAVLRGTRMSCKVLYVSGWLGLGHVIRDLAIAAEMRRMCPEVDIAWIAGSPASEVLAEAG
jgi:hypothetical protein